MSVRQTEKIIKYKSRIFQEIVNISRSLFKDPISEEARKYVKDRISTSNLQLYEAGYVPDNENLNLLTSKIAIDKLQTLGITYTAPIQDNDCQVPTERFTLSEHNLILPYRDIYGNIIGLVGRTLLSEENRKKKKLQKYKYTKFNKSLHLFGLYQTKDVINQLNSVVVVEGQIDCMTCREYGVGNVVALGGCDMTKYQFQLLTRYTDNINLALDNDEEGQKAADKLIKKYGRLANIKKINIPGKFKDIDACLRGGVSALDVFKGIQ